MDERNLYWLAGLLEGEGSFCAGQPNAPNQPRISINMTDKDVMQRVSGLFRMTLTIEKRRKQHWKDSYTCQIRGKKAVEWMKRLRPLMGQRRQGQIDASLSSYRPGWSGKLQDSDIPVIRELLAKGVSQAKVAERFAVARSTIGLIKQGRTWAHVRG